MNWQNCIICLKGSGNLRFPTDSLQKNGQEIYRSFLTAVRQSLDVDALPVQVDFKEGTPKKLMENKAKWHKSCHLKFALSKLERIKESIEKKRKKETDDNQRSSKRQATHNTKQRLVYILCKILRNTP